MTTALPDTGAASTAAAASRPNIYVLTAEHLRALGACSEEVTRFRRAFPRGAELTVARCVRNCANWDVEWLVTRALDDVGFKLYYEVDRDARTRANAALVRARSQHLGGVSHPSAEYYRDSRSRYYRASQRIYAQYSRDVARAFVELLPQHASERFARVVRGDDRG